MIQVGGDIESRSVVDLTRSGVSVYARHPSTIFQCFSWWEPGDQAPRVWYKWEPPPRRLMELAADPNVMWRAWNAPFEFTMWEEIAFKRMGWPQIPLHRWSCTQARALALGLPPKLEKAAEVLSPGFRKDMAGHRLMMHLCRPTNHKAMKENPLLVPEWDEDRDKHIRQGEYCCNDVRVENAIADSIPDWRNGEHEAWQLSEEINLRGVALDVLGIERALGKVQEATARLNAEMEQATGGAVPTVKAVPKLRKFLQTHGIIPPDDELEEDPDRSDVKPGADVVQDEARDFVHGFTDLAPDVAPIGHNGGPPLDDPAPKPAAEKKVTKGQTDKKAIQGYIAELERQPDGRLHPAYRPLKIRQEAGRASVYKLNAMLAGVDTDGRARGLHLYHRASTGRYAGVRIQVQNLIRDCFNNDDADEYVAALQNHTEAEMYEQRWIYGTTHGAVARMLRPFIIASPGHRLVWADFNAVEARGVAWFAGAATSLKLFRDNAAIYEEMATLIYDFPVTKENKEERFVGKQTVLGCGFGMGPPKFQGHCERLGNPVTVEIAEKGVYGWREANPEVPQYWYALTKASLNAVRSPGVVQHVVTDLDGVVRLSFLFDGQWLRMQLPSGRWLWYSNPRITLDENDREQLEYDAWNNLTKKWQPERTWGGKLLENGVQAHCRDLLVAAMFRLRKAGYRIVLHVHDDITNEVPLGRGSPDEVVRIMEEVPIWSAGFPVKAEGASGRRYGIGIKGYG